MPLPFVYRKIGDATIHGIGFGVMGISFHYGATEEDERRFETLNAAYESGARHWDTSNFYGDSEELIGKWIKRNPEKRKDIFLATKFGITPDGPRGDPEHVRECIEKSLKDLNTDYVDLFYVHRIDNKIPIEVTIRALSELVREGKVKYIGLSECSAATLRRAHKVHPISAIQVEYSPLVLDIHHNGVLAAARELGITVVAYSPLARGMITGQFKSYDDFELDDFRRTIPKFSRENFPKINNIVDRVQQIADNHHATTSQIALAWILAQGGDFVVIPGTKKAKYVSENMKAENIQLSYNEVETLNALAREADTTITGGRYGDNYIHLTFGDTPEEIAVH
ncbi:hypothetical protein AX16_004330 [Volvariella volvacea WC 439]|nr:hypothetical protein AX16_004330 [Volvariella volvacea WC 439]